jgi:hypothetical protein
MWIAEIYLYQESSPVMRNLPEVGEGETENMKEKT